MSLRSCDLRDGLRQRGSALRAVDFVAAEAATHKQSLDFAQARRLWRPDSG